jgi:phage-related protein
MSGDAPRYTFEFFTTPAGHEVVRDEIRDVLGTGPPRKELGALLTRIQHCRQLDRDTAYLGKDLWEARLTDRGNEYRLYYAHDGSRAVLLGLLFHQKGGRGAQPRAIRKARKRLADWKRTSI